MYYVDARGRAHGKIYYDDLRLADQAKFEAPFRYLADTGQLRNTEKWRHEGDGIWCFKIPQHRLAAFYEDDGRDIVITHGFSKKSDKIPPGEMDRAKRLRDEYLQRRDRI